MSSHVRVEIGAGDVVSIALPTFMVKVCREDAAILRDKLNSVLPEQITDLMHDPRIHRPGGPARGASLARRAWPGHRESGGCHRPP